MDIKCIQNMYKSANGVNDITYYLFQPEGVELRGVIQIVHGMCDYFSRYTAFAKYLCGLGFVVCGNDHLGHGGSAPKVSDLGFFAVQDGWKFLVRDVAQLSEIMKKRYPQLPYFVMGHSMGSLIVRLYLMKYGKTLSGAILCGTIGPQPFAGMAIRMADSIVRSKSPTYRSGFLAKAALRGYNRRFEKQSSGFGWISRDPKAVAMFQSDEKCNFLLTSSAYRDLFQLVLQSNRAKCFKQTPHHLPMLILAGDKDPVGSCGEGVRHVASLYHAAGVRSVDLIFYKGARHDLLNEINRKDVYGDISRWLEVQLEQSNAENVEKTNEPE